MEAIGVKRLSVNVVTGEAKDDPYGQGFAAISATSETDDEAVAQHLLHASREGEAVTVRCAMLDVTGPVTKLSVESGVTTFVVWVEQLAYRDPHAAA